MTDAEQPRYFVYRLNPPRPTFADDMTDAERATMREHAGYRSELAQAGIAVVFGPVADPSGVWGLAVVQAPDEGTVWSLGERDPAVATGMVHLRRLRDARCGPASLNDDHPLPQQADSDR
jgi:hypothetical protein